MACFIAPVPSFHHRVPVMRRKFHPYFSPSWFDRALLNSFLEESSSCGCDDPAFIFERPVLRLDRISGLNDKKSDDGKDKNVKSFACDDNSERTKEANFTEHHQKNKKEKDDFRLTVRIGKHDPNDLKVKVCDGVLTVSGKVSEGSENDGMYSEYTFTREYTLPKNVNVDGMTSKLTEDGLLVFHAPFLALEEPKEKEIPTAVRETKEEEKSSGEIEEKGEEEKMENEELSEQS